MTTLSRGQIDVLVLHVAGLTEAAIAQRLHLAGKAAVNERLDAIYAAVGADNPFSLIRRLAVTNALPVATLARIVGKPPTETANPKRTHGYVNLSGLRDALPEGEPVQSATDTERLSAREVEVLLLSFAGSTCAQVSDALGISRRTVEFHVRNLYRKLEVHSRQEALRRVLALGIIDRARVKEAVGL